MAPNHLDAIEGLRALIHFGLKLPNTEVEPFIDRFDHILIKESEKTLSPNETFFHTLRRVYSNPPGMEFSEKDGEAVYSGRNEQMLSRKDEILKELSKDHPFSTTPNRKDFYAIKLRVSDLPEDNRSLRQNNHEYAGRF